MLRAAVLALVVVTAAAAACERTGETGDPAAPANSATPERPRSAPLPDPTPATRAAAAPWRGMTFAHEGYDGLTGYGGPSVGPSLDSLAALGVDAVAIVPYTFLRDAGVPAPLAVPERRGAETDRAVRASIDAAHARGLRVLLKPQIWVGGGAWPGEIDFDDGADWEAFLGHYRTWMLHYARLAADADVEALAVGTELSRATLEHPGFWRKLIAEVREAYGGTVTYAANWGEEFERLAFWDAVDVVGLNAYYPLSADPEATDAELLAGARAWLRTADAVAAAADKPLWLTEVGYRSARRAWLNPHAAADGRPVSEECQRRCFAALASAAAESARLTGAFVWKWPSYLGHVGGSWDGGGRDAGTGFTPGGKEAGAVVARWYAGWD